MPIFSQAEKDLIWSQSRDSIREEPTPRQWALYRLLCDLWPTKESPISQKEIITALPQCYQESHTARNNDICRAIYTDVDELNKCFRTDFLIGKTHDYQYYIMQSIDEIRDYARQFYSAMSKAEQRFKLIEQKYDRNLTGQGKFIREGRKMTPVDVGKCEFHPNLKEVKSNRDKLKDMLAEMSAQRDREKQAEIEQYIRDNPDWDK